MCLGIFKKISPDQIFSHYVKRLSGASSSSTHFKGFFKIINHAYIGKPFTNVFMTCDILFVCDHKYSYNKRVRLHLFHHSFICQVRWEAVLQTCNNFIISFWGRSWLCSSWSPNPEKLKMAESQPTLVYVSFIILIQHPQGWNVRALGEPIRLVLKYLEVDSEDKRIHFGEMGPKL